MAATRADDMELAAALHHSAYKGAGPETLDAVRSQKTANSREEAVYFELFDEDTAGLRRTSLVEPRGPLEGVQQHIMEHADDIFPFVQILDAPVVHEVDNVMDAFRLLDSPIAEQDIDVPKISEATIQQRLVDRDLRFPQMAEQLVEVPNVLSFASLHQQFVEQIVDIPVPRPGV